jgi:ubiquinone/menaquinone biosynthesis C-methylase UbiE
VFSFLKRKPRSLPIQEVLRRAEKLALRSADRPSPQLLQAFQELAPALRVWGRRHTAERLERASAGQPGAEIVDDRTALELTTAARKLREMHDQIRASFDRDSADEEHFPSTIDPRIYHVKLILDHFGDLSDKRVLDVGCGKGRFARILHERYPQAHISAVDISAGMLQYVPEGIETQQASMTDLPFPDASFDAVYATESLEHAVEIEAAVAEMCRVTRPGGRLVIIDKNIEHAGRLATPPWEKWFDRREMERLLSRHCHEVSSELISYWEDVAPDGLFLAWKAVR